MQFFYKSNYSFGIHTISPSVFFGFGDATMPFPEFFSMGGQDSFFGFREDEERGRQMVKGSLEYRIQSPLKIFFDTYLSIRYDLGSVWEQTEAIRFNDLKHGIGTSVSFDTPLGPAEFSLGKSFYFIKKPYGIAWGPVQGYFSIGMDL